MPLPVSRLRWPVLSGASSTSTITHIVLVLHTLCFYMCFFSRWSYIFLRPERARTRRCCRSLTQRTPVLYGKLHSACPKQRSPLSSLASGCKIDSRRSNYITKHPQDMRLADAFSGTVAEGLSSLSSHPRGCLQNDEFQHIVSGSTSIAMISSDEHQGLRLGMYTITGIKESKRKSGSTLPFQVCFCECSTTPDS